MQLPYFLSSFRSTTNWVAFAVTCVAALIVWLRPEVVLHENYFLSLSTTQNSRLSELLDPVTYAGFSSAESWGRWSDGRVARILTKVRLPVVFDLEMTGQAFGPNAGVPIAVCVGDQCHDVVFGKAPTTLVRRFEEVDVREIAFHIPHPTSPNSLGQNADTRLLGLGLRGLKIEEVP